MSRPNNVLAAEAKHSKIDRLATQIAARPASAGQRLLRNALGFPKPANVFTN